jgi:4-hydroxybenzoyl-CoA reductase subunit beta
MHLPEFEHLQPASLEEAVSFLSEHEEEARVIGGGTDLLVSLKNRLLAPDYLIDLKRIPELDSVTYSTATGLRIGALTRLAALIRSPLVTDHFPVIALAASSVAAPQIRTMSTLAGNLCQDTRCFYYNQSEEWRTARPNCFKGGGSLCLATPGASRCYSAYQGDMAPVLIALNAQARITSNTGQRSIPLLDLYTGKGENHLGLKRNEVLTELQIPPHTGIWGCDYQKLRQREAMDFPLLGVAVVLGRHSNGQECGLARVVLTAVASAPVVIEEAGLLLQGERLDKALIDRAADAVYQAVRPIASIGSTPLYRRKMVRVLTRRAINRAWGGS